MSIQFDKDDTLIPHVILGDIVEHARTFELAKLVEINRQFGWFIVKYLSDERTMRHTIAPNGNNQSFNKLTNEERADLFLKLENAGLTDHWRD